MKEGLAKIKAVAGVRDSFICDNHGEVIASAVSSGLDTNTLNSISREVTLVMAAMEMADEAMREMDCTYEGVRLVARNMAHATLIVLCELQIDIAMLRLTMDVVKARFQGDGGIQSQFAARAREKELSQEDVDETSWHLLTLLDKGGDDRD
jgi:hypothetical protein